jgi:hypothetical protein
MPRGKLFASGVCIVQLRSTLACAELFLLAPFAPTSEPAPLVAVCLLFGHVVLRSHGTPVECEPNRPGRAVLSPVETIEHQGSHPDRQTAGSTLRCASRRWSGPAPRSIDRR